jgi:hypothetical protein
MWTDCFDIFFQPGCDLIAALIQCGLLVAGTLFLALAIICMIGDAHAAIAARRAKRALVRMPVIDSNALYAAVSRPVGSRSAASRPAASRPASSHPRPKRSPAFYSAVMRPARVASA